MIPTMERDGQQSNSKPNKRSSSNKLFKLLPRAATSAISFQNPPFSPGRSSDNNTNNNKTHHRSHSHVGKGFSGPLMIIPTEARRRAKNEDDLDFGAAEPVSPKISCMGQIKHKKKMKKKEKEKAQFDKSRSKRRSPPKKQASAIRRIFGGGKQRRAGEKSVGSGADAAPELARLSDRGAPGLGQMRRFASGREAFSGFDWSEVQVAPVDSEQRDRCEAEEEEEEEEDEVMIPFSAPILRGGGGGRGGVDIGGGGGGVNLQPRKEINLWKRRTMAPPQPLQLHPSDGKH